MRYKMVLSYSGKGFFGWQSQSDALSVQETIEKALSTLLGKPTPIVGAGRTDTGVSAVGYVAHFDVPSEINASRLCYKLNAILPPSISIDEINSVEPDFHARFGAKSRSYSYFLHRHKDPLLEGVSYFCGYPDLDFNLMNQAAQLLLGTHDFSCFQKKGSDNKTTICTVTQAYWAYYTPISDAMRKSSTATPAMPSSGNYWCFCITADRFLRNMVRAIVGTLIEVGRGKRSLENFATLLNGGSRSMSGESAPAHALFFTSAQY